MERFFVKTLKFPTYKKNLLIIEIYFSTPLIQLLEFRNNLKINLEKCFFGNKEVSYLGFTLTPAGIKPGKNKLKAIKDAKPPTDVKTIRSFVGLCNFFRTHIKNFAIIAAPLFKLTRKDSGYKGGPLPKEAMAAFSALQNALMSEPIMAFPRADRQYALITDAATGTADTLGGLGAILTQKDQYDNNPVPMTEDGKIDMPYLKSSRCFTATKVWHQHLVTQNWRVQVRSRTQPFSGCVRSSSYWRHYQTNGI